MNQYMGLTSNADDQPLYVDTTAPLHILLDSAAYRIRAATQFLENLAMRDEQTLDPATLQDLAQLCCIPLRDGCDCATIGCGPGRFHSISLPADNLWRGSLLPLGCAAALFVSASHSSGSKLLRHPFIVS